jgi:MEDS: MEthanogen/methylotroph, DcmR Sensory domain
MVLPSISCTSHHADVYRDDGVVEERVAHYLADGLAAARPAIAIVTTAHRAGILERLHELGADPDGACQSGRLQLLDADDLVRSCRASGRLEPDWFERSIGALVRAAGAESPPVVFAELVDLLWAHGLPQLALDLEWQWSMLAADVGFSRYCAYHLTTVGDDVEAVAAVHGTTHIDPASATGGREVDEITLAPTLEAPAAARAFAARALEGVQGEHASDTVALVLSELCNNAVLHVGAPFRVGIAQLAEDIWIGVTDPSATLPHLARSPSDAPSGRGVALVDTLASRWGVDQLPHGKRIWAIVEG